MIVPNTRAQFNYDDLKLVSEIVWGHELSDREAGKLITNLDLLNRTLDDKKILNVINSLEKLDKPSPSLYFYIVVRHALLEEGVIEDEIADYLAAVLIAFSKRDRAWQIDDYDDAIYNYVIDLRQDGMVEHQPLRKFRLHVHLGNFALWLGGIFPRHVLSKGLSLKYFDVMGQKGFVKASLNPQAKKLDLVNVFEGISDQYLSVRTAFNALSERMSFVGDKYEHN